MAFAMILIYLSDYVWLQIQLIYVISTMMIMYIAFQKPWERVFFNKLELMNEYSIFFLSYHLMCFTDFY